jgi:transketolase
MRNTITRKITEFAEEHPNVFLITGDAGFGVLEDFQCRFPDRFLNLGVAEQNTISFASGLGLAGFKVFVYNIIPFLLYRCYEQVRNDICYQKIPVTLLGIGSGVTYAPMGMTHYSVEDVAIARTLSNLVILSPADPVEAEKCAEFSMKCIDPVYIRVAKHGEPAIHSHNSIDIEKPLRVCEGSRVAVLFHGSISQEVLKATAAMPTAPRVFSIPMLHPLNFNSLHTQLDEIHTLITVEEHFMEGGLGSIISDWIAREKLPYRLHKVGIKNEFIHTIKNTPGIRQHYGLSSAQIRREIENAFTRS